MLKYKFECAWVHSQGNTFEAFSLERFTTSGARSDTIARLYQAGFGSEQNFYNFYVYRVDSDELFWRPAFRREWRYVSDGLFRSSVLGWLIDKESLTPDNLF